MEEVAHRGVVLVHGMQREWIREVRKIKVKRKNKKEGVGASCVRGERPRRRRSSGGWQGWSWAAWGLRWGGDGFRMERGGRGLSRQRRGRELMALKAALRRRFLAVSGGGVIDGRRKKGDVTPVCLSVLTCGPHTSVTEKEKGRRARTSLRWLG